MRVLVVDDDILIRRYFQRSLRHYAEVHVANGVVEALSMLRAMRFDVLITDEHMPDGSGRALLSKACTIQVRCRRVLISAAELAPSADDACERFFPKVGGLPQVVAWVRTAAAAPSP